MPSKRPEARFADIVENIDAIVRYTARMSEGQFLADSKTLDAAERCLLRISEAAVKLGDLGERLAPDQPWPGIRGIGNRLRHDYDTIDRGEIWRIVTGDLASLRTSCTSAIEQLRKVGDVD